MRHHDNQKKWSVALSSGVLSLVLLSAPAQAGPWTKSLGEFYVKLGEGLFLSDSYVDSSGRTVSGTDYFGATTSVYFEVGVYRSLQLSGYLPYIVGSNTFDDGASFIQGGGGDAVFGVQYTPPLALPIPYAVRVDVKIPLYDVDMSGIPFATQFPALGDGQIDLSFWLSAGGSVPNLPLYAYGELGYRHRTEAFIGDGPGDGRDYGDGVVLFLQTGYTFFERLLLTANFGGVLSLEKSELTKSYLTLGPGLYLPLWRGLAAEAAFDPVVYANNSAPGMSFSLGVSYKN